MYEFNPDGSIKIPGVIAENLVKKEMKLQKERCVLVKKELVNFSPKKCVLHIKISEAFPDSDFVMSIFHAFTERADVVAKLVKISEKEFDIEIGTDFHRCKDCCNLVARFREFLDGNVIEDKGSCTLKERSFAYEDYF